MSRSAKLLSREVATCGGLFLLAALVRVLFLYGTVDRDLPFSIFYYGDSRLYREYALALMRGEIFDQGIPFHPPAFAYVLSWVIRLVGERPTGLRAVLAIVSATTVPLTYLLGRALWSRSVALAASLLATFSFGLLVVSVSANTETIYVPILVAQALLLVLLGDALVERRGALGRILSVSCGLLLGVGALTRAEHLGLAVVLPVALALGWRTLPLRRIAAAAAVLIGTAAVVIAPWTIHNYRALMRFNASNPDVVPPLPTLVLVSGYGPLNFALANNAGADGTFRADAAVASMGKGRLDFRDARQRELYRDGYRLGWKYLSGHPGAAARLVERKLDLAADAFALGFGLSDRPGGLRGTRRPVDLFVPDRKPWKPVSLVLLALGLFFSRARWRRASVLCLAGLHVLVVSLAFFGYARFLVQLAPFVFLFQASALVALVARVPSVRARRVVAVVGLALTVFLVGELLVAAARPRNFRASGSADPTTGKIVQDASVEIEPVP